SSFLPAPAPTSVFSRSSSASTCWPALICASSRSSCDLSAAVESSSPPPSLAPLLAAPGARLHLLVLSLRPLDREAGVAHLLADPRRRLADPDLRFGCRVLGLGHFLLRAEGLDRGGKLPLGCRELLLLALELLHLPVEVLELLLCERLSLA